jgi:hypothetical protein
MSVVHSCHLTAPSTDYSMKLGQLTRASFERDTIPHTYESSNNSRAYINFQPHITMGIPYRSSRIIQMPDDPDDIDTMGYANALQPNDTTVPSGMILTVQRPSQSPVQSEPSPPPPRTACLRCRGKKSRCSGQRPCGGCSNNGLECTWDETESDTSIKPERPTRKSEPARRTDTKRRLTKGKDAAAQVRSACTRCQQRKAKCSGTRPACTYCTERNLDCTYSVAEGATRTNDLKRRLRETSNKAHVFGLLLEVMRQGTDEEATTLLARLRIGETLQVILRSLPVSASSPNGEFQSELNRRVSAL